MKSKVRIIADYREETSGVVRALRQISDVVVEVRPLRLGDYRVAEDLVVERKRMIDLVGSLKDGRLFSQARRLANSDLTSAVILEGRGRDLIGCEMRREAILGAVVSLAVVYGLAVLRSVDPVETAQVLAYAAGQLQRHRAEIPRRHGVRPKTKRRVQLRLLEGLPGVGPKKAVALLERFGSVAAVFHADQEELELVDGVGRRLADRIRWAVE